MKKLKKTNLQPSSNLVAKPKEGGDNASEKSNSEALEEMSEVVGTEQGEGQASAPPTPPSDPADEGDGAPPKASGSGSKEEDDAEPDLDKPKAEGATDQVTKEEPAEPDDPEVDEGTEGAEEDVRDVAADSPGDDDPGAADSPAPVLAAVPTVPALRSPSAPVADLDPVALEHFTDKTGSSPADQATRLQGHLDDVHADASDAQQTITAHGETEMGRVDGAITTADATVQTGISTGRKRVSGAFDRARDVAVGEADTGLKAVDEAWGPGRERLAGVATTHRDAVKDTMTGSTEAVEKERTDGTQGYLSILQEGAATLGAVGAEVKTQAIAEGDAKAKVYSDQAQSLKGIESLHEESKATIAKQVGAGAGSAIDMRVKVRQHNLEARAAESASTAVEVQTQPLQDKLEETREAADTNIDSGETQALARLDASRTSAKGTITSSRDAIDGKTEEEKERAQARLDAAESALRVESTNMGLELRNSIEVRAATHAASYAEVTDDMAALVEGIDGPYRAADVEPTLTAAREAIASTSEEHIGELTELTSEGITTFEGGIERKIDSFDLAVEEQEKQAGDFRDEQTRAIRTAVTGFTGGIAGMVDQFDTRLAEQVSPVADKARALQEGAAKAIDDYQHMAKEAFDNVKEELETLAEEELAKIPEQVETGALAETNQKRSNIVSNDVPDLYSAMDGLGTDESGIYSILRKMTWGQIEALEVLWDECKAHSLRWYFRDEMSGSELDIAMAYLDHDRVKALKMELEDSVGFWNDDEARIEEVMRAASADEMSTLTTEHADTIESVSDNLGGADLATFSALADTDLSREDAKLKADAVRLQDAMDGMGTDEATVKRILEGAKTPEEREKLRAFYQGYAGDIGDDMSLDARLDDEFTGAFGEQDDIHLVRELAKVDRDDAAVSAAKVFSAGNGGGTDETAMFDALKSDVGKWDSQITMLEAQLNNDELTDPDQRAALEIQLAELSQKRDSHFATLDSKIAEFSGDSTMNMEGYIKSELEEGLELKIGMDSLKKGKPDPADVVMYATEGTGTDEDMLKKALQDDSGNPLSKAEVAKINESLIAQGKPPLSDIAAEELSGRDLHDLTKLLKGKPETPEDFNELVQMDYEFETSGSGRILMDLKGAMGISTAAEEMDYAKDQFDAKYDYLVDQGMHEMNLQDIAAEDPELAQTFKELGITSQKSSEAYGKSLAATVDGLVTALEIIGGVIATILTAGAASPALALLIANIAIGTTGIIIKKGLVGDAYAWEEAGADFVKLVSTSALGAALGKVEKIGKVADKVGKSGTDMFKSAGSRTGMFFTGKGWELGPKQTAYLQTFITGGSKSVMTGAAEDTYKGLWNDDNFDAGVEHWIGGALSSGATNVHQNFLTGGSMATYGKYAGDQKKAAFTERAEGRGVDVDDIDADALTHGSMAKDMLYGARDGLNKHVIGHVVNTSNYADAGKFWEGLVAGGPKAMLSGAVSAYGDRKALPANVARDLEQGAMSPEQYRLLHGELTYEEQLAIGQALPPSRMPPELSGMVQDEAKLQLTSVVDSPVDGTPSLTYDQDKIATADVATLGQALQGGMSFDEIKDRTFTSEEKLVIARLAAGTDKLPATFLDSVSVEEFRALDSFRVVLAVEIGWDRLPEALRKDSYDEISTGSVNSTYTLLNKFKGEDLPEELREAVTKSVDDMVDEELVKVGESYGFSNLDKLGPHVRTRVAGALGTSVSSGVSSDPKHIAAAIQLGELELTDQALDDLDLDARSKLDVLVSMGKNADLSVFPADFKQDAMDSVLTLRTKERYHVATERWDLLDAPTRDEIWSGYAFTDLDYRLKFVASVPEGDIPSDVRDAMAQDLRDYKVQNAMMRRISALSKSDVDKLEALAGTDEEASP